jgi:hypothetical protein
LETWGNATMQWAESLVRVLSGAIQLTGTKTSNHNLLISSLFRHDEAV